VTERLYYADAYLREFEATIVDRSEQEGRPAVVLDRTAFYPTSGGQPFDVGTLGTARVLDVIDDDAGRILHVVDRVPEGPAVSGTIDWTRRFDHMQQHTGQHVLSAAFDRALGVRTESFHLGADYSTIDLAREVTAAEVARAEDEANRVVWEDRPVTVRFAGADEAASMPLRKEPKRDGTLRLVAVQDFDLSACGGTHVSRTGAIGTIVVSATERFRGGSRLTFLCGGRTLHGYRALRDAVGASVRALSVLPADLPAAIERMQGEARDLRRLVKDYQSRVAVQEADALAETGVAAGSVTLVAASLTGWDAGGLKTIAGRIAERAGFLVVLVGDSPPSAIVVARGPGVTHDAAAILRAIVARHGGKGGGKPELAQGGGVSAPAAEVLATARVLAAAHG
jgi:alanyl-tRNA synthetase